MKRLCRFVTYGFFGLLLLGFKPAAHARPVRVDAVMLAAAELPAQAEAAPAAEPSDVDKQFGDVESRSHRSDRISFNIKVATFVILALFVLCRLWLLWQISRGRKKIAQENIFQPK